MKYLTVFMFSFFLSCPLLADGSLCQRTGGQWERKDKRCFCKPKFKNFQKLYDLPWTIQQCFKKPSVVKACVSKDCFPLTHIGNGVFVTNQHVLSVINKIEELKKKFSVRNRIKHEPEHLGRGENITNSIYTLTIFVNGKPQELKASLFRRGQKSLTAKEIYNHDWDVAAFRIPELQNLPFAKIAETDQTQNSSVYSIAPENQDENFKGFLYSSGSIIGKRDGSIKTDHLGMQGHSGGPIFNGKCELVGLFWGKETTLREDPIGLDSTTITQVPFDPRRGCSKQPLREQSYLINILQIQKIINLEVPNKNKVVSPTYKGVR